MYIVRVEREGSSARHILYKTERGALLAIERIEKEDEHTTCKLFEQVGTHHKQERMVFDGNEWPF